MRLSELLLESRVQDLITKYGDKLVDKLSKENVSISDSRTAIQEFNKNNPSGKWVFTEWLIVNYLKNNIRYEDLYKVKNYIPLFIRYNTELDNRDILQYNTLQELYIAVEPFMHKAVVKDTRKGKEVEQDTIDELEQKLFKTNQAKILYEDSTYKVVKINSYKASVYFGSGSQWCISNKDDKHYWEHYTSKEPNVTFVLIKNSNEKFAFLPKANEFRDNADNMLELNKFFTDHPKLIEILNPKEWLEYNIDSNIQKQIMDVLQLVDINDKIISYNEFGNMNNLTIDFLNLKNTKITKLPDNLTVKRVLNLENTPIQKLPNNLTVINDLILYDTPITELPNDLQVGGKLDLSNSKITKLPNNLTVDKLLLTNTPITELPDNLNVEGNLTIRNSKITKLPDNLNVGGNLNLENTPITELPNNLTVKGTLYINYTNITKLPDNLYVGGDLEILFTKITELPDTLLVKGRIWRNEHMKLKYIPTHLKRKIKIW